MGRGLALLRGINVGGHRRLPMAPLRELFSALGCTDVASYIQSGNVVFTADCWRPERLRTDLESAMAERFGFDVGVLLRSSAQWDALIDDLPFDRIDADADDRHYLVALLSAPADPADAARLEAEAVAPERLRVMGDRVYLHCPNGQAGSRLGLALIERRLDRLATARNWRTVRRLQSML